MTAGGLHDGAGELLVLVVPARGGDVTGPYLGPLGAPDASVDNDVDLAATVCRSDLQDDLRRAFAEVDLRVRDPVVVADLADVDGLPRLAFDFDALLLGDPLRLDFLIPVEALELADRVVLRAHSERLDGPVFVVGELLNRHAPVVDLVDPELLLKLAVMVEEIMLPFVLD